MAPLHPKDSLCLGDSPLQVLAEPADRVLSSREHVPFRVEKVSMLDGQQWARGVAAAGKGERGCNGIHSQAGVASGGAAGWPNEEWAGRTDGAIAFAYPIGSSR